MGYMARGRTRARAITLRVRPTLPSDRRFASSAIFTGRKGVRSEKSADERHPAGDERLGLPGVVGARLPTPRGERQAPLLRGSIPDRGGEFDVLSPPSSLRYGLVGQADPRGVPVRGEVPADDHPRPAPCAHGRGARPLPRGPETDPRGGKFAAALLQLPPSLPFEPTTVRHFYETLPRDLPVAVEFRERSWLAPESIGLLR